MSYLMEETIMDSIETIRYKFSALAKLIPPYVENQEAEVSIRTEENLTIARITFGPIMASWFDAARLCDVLSEVRKGNANPLVLGDVLDISDLPDKAYAGLSITTPVTVGDNTVYAVDESRNCYLEIRSRKSPEDIRRALDEAFEYLRSGNKKADDFHPSTTYYNLNR